MKKLTTISALLMLPILQACAPATNVLREGTATTDTRLSYKIEKFEEVYSTQGITATHVLRSNIVRIESGGGVRYFGIPERTQSEFSSLMRSTCEAEGKRYVDVAQDGDAQTKKVNLYFTCA